MLAKHEHGAASAAATYAKIRGGLGVVVATSGGGALNLTHGLAEARASRVQLLAIVGEPPSDLQGRGAFQDTSGRDAVDALAVLGAAAGFCRRVTRAENALQLLDEALAHIAAEMSPAVLLIAKDQQCAQAASRGERESMLPAPSLPRLPFTRVFASARQLSQGRCTIIAGDEVLRARARCELAQLAAALDASVAVTPDARDAFDNSDPRFIGVAGAMGSEGLATELQDARTCLLVGTRLPLLARMGLEARLRLRRELEAELSTLESVDVFPSRANFLLIRTPYPAHLVFDQLLARGVLVRIFEHAPRLDRCLRITAGTLYENARCIHALRETLAVLQQKASPNARRADVARA